MDEQQTAPTEPPKMKPIYTMEQVKDLFGVKKCDTIKKYVKNGILPPPIKLQRRLIWTGKMLEGAIQALEENPTKFAS